MILETDARKQHSILETGSGYKCGIKNVSLENLIGCIVIILYFVLQEDEEKQISVEKIFQVCNFFFLSDAYHFA